MVCVLPQAGNPACLGGHAKRRAPNLLASAFRPKRTIRLCYWMPMFWGWHNLKKVYAALIIILALALFGSWVADEVGAPDWLTSVICGAAFIAWAAVGAGFAIRQHKENQSTDL